MPSVDRPRAPRLRGTNSVFWGGVTAGRLLAIPLSTYFTTDTLFRMDVLGCVASSSLLLLMGRVREHTLHSAFSKWREIKSFRDIRTPRGTMFIQRALEREMTEGKTRLIVSSRRLDACTKCFPS